MRKIFINSRIEAIAEDYKQTVQQHLHYGSNNHLVNPRRKLLKLKQDFDEYKSDFLKSYEQRT